MRLVQPSMNACDQAREQISRELDHELPELDRARLDTHLAGCPACRRFRNELRTASTLLRTAALEEPSVAISIPRRRFTAVRTLQTGAAAAAVAIIAGLSAVGGLSSREAAAPSFQLGSHVRDRGDELVPGHVARARPQRLGDRIAL